MKQLPIDLVLQNELCTVIWLVCWQLDTHTSRFPPEKKNWKRMPAIWPLYSKLSLDNAIFCRDLFESRKCSTNLAKSLTEFMTYPFLF